jgi:hypothetical protein
MAFYMVFHKLQVILGFVILYAMIFTISELYLGKCSYNQERKLSPQGKCD